MRIVHQPLPTDGRPRLLEIRPHDDDEVVAHGVRDRTQAARVLVRRLRIVDGARPDDDEEAAAVAAMENVANRASGLEHERGGGVARRLRVLHRPRRDERHDVDDVPIFESFRHDMSPRQKKSPESTLSGLSRLRNRRQAVTQYPAAPAEAR